MSYSAKSDVRLFLPRALVLQGENPTPNPRDPRPESLLDTDMNSYITMADSIINGRLATIYDVPLRKANIGGIVDYPYPIRMISAVFSAWMIWQQRLSGSEKAASEFVERMYKIATQQLDNIENKRIRLRGQDSYTVSRTVRNDLWAAPMSASKENAQTGG